MLQRAASNAYSWWWASHIRTKQSKWLEQNLQDMEEKVGYTLKLIEEDGDSFAKRAEMYYKKRPELINFVKESYHAYRALAERYDHISTELQNANSTLAAVCPEQFQFAMEDDEEFNPPRSHRKPPKNAGNIPKVPNMPRKDFRSTVTSATKRLQASKPNKRTTVAKVAKSVMDKQEGLKEIDKFQKQILALQTEKEFVHSSYVSWLAKHWEIEDQINELQQKVCNLQDEFGEGIIIEDEEARNLMASVALKSCQETLAQMQEKQEKSAEEVNTERQRIKDAREKLDSLKKELLGNEANQKKPVPSNDSVKVVAETERSDEGLVNAAKEREELELLRQKIKEQLEDGSNASLTVIEMAEKIDEVVNKVVGLETAFSSQTSLVQRLRKETGELQEQIRSLEEDKETLINDKNNLSSKLMEMEEKLSRLQDLNRSFEDNNKGLQKQFYEARCNLDHLSEKLKNVKREEEREHSSQTEEKSPAHAKFQNENEGQEAVMDPNNDFKELEDVKLSEEIKGREAALNDGDDLKEKQRVNPSDKPKVNNSSEGEKTSPSKIQFEKGIVGLESVTNLANEKLHSEGPDGVNKLSDSPQNKKESVVEASSKEQKEKPHGCEVPEKAGKVQTKVVDDIEKHVSATPGNQGKAVTDDQGNLSDKILEKSREQMIEDKVQKQTSSEKPDNFLNVERQDQATKQEFEPDWKQMFLEGLENREKTILAEYTSVLRNYKELKKKFDEDDKKNEDNNRESTRELQQLRSANVEKDQEIRSLRQKLSILQAAFGENNDLDYQNAEQKTTMIETTRAQPTNTDVDISVIREEPRTTSEIEEKFRTNIDELLEENLDFWLRFSTSFHEIQKFETQVKDLQSEVTKLEEKQKKHEGSSSAKYSLRSDGRPLYKHLKEIETELTLWMEKCALLKEELKSRFSSLCKIQEEIINALKVSAEDDEFNFTSYQAAKFQGEILNMKQENNKVADELQAGLDHVTNLLLEVEKTLNLLGEKFGLSESKSHPKDPLNPSSNRNRVPLQSFIFGVKPKKQRSSFFSCVHPSLGRKYNGFMAYR